MNYTIEHYMDMNNPTEAMTGVRRAVQGFGICGKYGYQLFHTGICAVYDMETREPEPLTAFRLGSYCDGPDKRYINHANDLVFVKNGDRNLMYIQAGNSGEKDETGFIAYCAVEELLGEGASASSRLVQRIYYNNDGIEETSFSTPAWGWPAYLPDAENGLLYMFSARYRTTKDFLHLYDSNNYILTAFRLPDTTEPQVVLRPSDILFQHILPFDILFTQGGTVHDGKVYFMFGCGLKYDDGMRVIDAKTGHTEAVNLVDSILGAEEPECCAFAPDGSLYINTNVKKGRLYNIKLHD
ncbi:MAG: hypothetical protein MJ137_03475 [Clostridia bacterium]|nr:hypothetical protein [Clostridia bacterium]